MKVVIRTVAPERTQKVEVDDYKVQHGALWLTLSGSDEMIVINMSYIEQFRVIE